jgi:hypothetical protein
VPSHTARSQKKENAKSPVTPSNTANASAPQCLSAPHYATICNEERQDYFNLPDELIEVFQPKNKFAEALVRDIADARWQILRIEICITNHWNFTLIEFGHQPITVTPELGELQVIDKAAKANQALISRFNRDIDKLHMRISRLERTLRTIHQHYPAAEKTPEQTNPKTPPPPSQPVENTPIDPTYPPVFVTENTPNVIAFFRQMFPGRHIVVLPNDDVAKGSEINDDMPDIPRKVA